MEPRKAVGWLAGVVLVVGLALLLVPTSVSGDVGCGSAVSPDSTEAIGAEFGDALGDIYAGGSGSDDGGYRTLCEDRISTQRMIAWPVIGLAILVGAFLALTSKGRAAAPESTPSP